MLGLLASSIYFLWVLVGVALNIDTFYPHQVSNVLFHRRSLQLRPLIILLEIHVSIRGELPLHLFAMKALMVGLVYLLGGFGKYGWGAESVCLILSHTHTCLNPRSLVYSADLLWLGYSEPTGLSLYALGNGARTTRLYKGSTVNADGSRVHLFFKTPQ